MARRLHHLTVDTLEDLPLPCRNCAFWEVADAPRGGASEQGHQAKARWVEATTAEWGPPGRLVYVDGTPAAFAVLVPGRYARRARELAHRPSDDALLLATMGVDEGRRGAGLARVLLQTVLRDTHERGGRAVEAYGSRGPARLGRCVLSEGFLLASGFALLHEDPRMPLLRLDLRKTVRWQESVAGALEQVVEALSRRRLDPAPVRPLQGPAGLLTVTRAPGG